MLGNVTPQNVTQTEEGTRVTDQQPIKIGGVLGVVLNDTQGVDTEC